MQETKLNCQGLACPQPVLKCKEIIQDKQPNRLLIVVDNQATQVNVSRFLKKQAYQVLSVKENQGLITLTAESNTRHRQTESAGPDIESNQQLPEANSQTDNQLVLITSDVMGHGDDDLGSKLMHNLIATLPEMGTALWRIILINGGVKLAIAGSPVLDKLKALEEEGISILVCGTCLDHFHLLEENQVGETTNMLDVVTSLQLASKVIKV